jgi:predicted SAM-dependent methyltransferase
MKNNKSFLRKCANRVFSDRTLRLLLIDLVRLKNRVFNMGKKDLTPKCTKLHLGCGTRFIDHWLNCDLMGSDQNIDFAGGRLPWKTDSIESAVSQHMVEHLELEEELLPLLNELHRVMKPQADIWISCPDLETICKSYVNHKMRDLIEDRARMWGEFSMGDLPDQHFINLFFHERGTHKNLFDYDILAWALAKSGFTQIKRSNETEFLQAHPEFPKRDDDVESVYVTAVNGS